MIILGGTCREISLIIYAVGVFNIILSAYIIYNQVKIKAMQITLGKDNSIMANMIKNLMGSIPR